MIAFRKSLKSFNLPFSSIWLLRRLNKGGWAIGSKGFFLRSFKLSNYEVCGRCCSLTGELVLFVHLILSYDSEGIICFKAAKFSGFSMAMFVAFGTILFIICNWDAFSVSLEICFGSIEADSTFNLFFRVFRFFSCSIIMYCSFMPPLAADLFLLNALDLSYDAGLPDSVRAYTCTALGSNILRKAYFYSLNLGSVTINSI